MPRMPVELWSAAAALAGGFGGTFVARAVARRLGIMNAPNPLVPQHVRPVAYLGGVGVALGVGAGFAAAAALGRPFRSAMSCLRSSTWCWDWSTISAS